jgi:hypothetical protein
VTGLNTLTKKTLNMHHDINAEKLRQDLNREISILSKLDKLPEPDEAFSACFRAYHKESAEVMHLTNAEKAKAFEGALFSAIF